MSDWGVGNSLSSQSPNAKLNASIMTHITLTHLSFIQSKEKEKKKKKEKESTSKSKIKWLFLA